MDDSMEMTSPSSQNRNTGMVKSTIKNNVLKFKESCTKGLADLKNIMIADGIKKTINHKKRTKITLPRTSSYENGNLRRCDRLRKSGYRRVYSLTSKNL